MNPARAAAFSKEWAKTPAALKLKEEHAAAFEGESSIPKFSDKGYPDMGMGRYSDSLSYRAWWSLGTLSYRVIITWLYNNTGKSVFVAAFFHTMMNLVFQLFPVKGSYLFDPRVTGLILAAVAIIVVIVWGPRTLVRNRDAPAKIH